MKTLIVLSALAAALITAPVPSAKAAATSGVEIKQTESNSVSAVRALITRCLPGVLSGKGATTAGLITATEATTRKMLGQRDGRVYTDPDAQVLMVDFQDVPVCKIIAMAIDPGVMADLVMRVFSEATTPFIRERFKFEPDGSFAAVYASGGGQPGVIIRISTHEADGKSQFASLSVERDLRKSAKAGE